MKGLPILSQEGIPLRSRVFFSSSPSLGFDSRLLLLLLLLALGVLL